MLGLQGFQTRETVHAVACDGVGLKHENLVGQSGRDADAGHRPLLEVALDLHRVAGRAPGAAVAASGRFVGFLGSKRDRKDPPAAIGVAKSRCQRIAGGGVHLVGSIKEPPLRRFAPSEGLRYFGPAAGLHPKHSVVANSAFAAARSARIPPLQSGGFPVCKLSPPSDPNARQELFCLAHHGLSGVRFALSTPAVIMAGRLQAAG